MSGLDREPTEPSQQQDADGARRLAVALDYDTGVDGAPRVVASGKGALAEALLDIAFAQGVRVREDADLAQLLSLVEVGDEIPVEAFLAVAEVLAYVYRANNDPRWAQLLTHGNAAGSATAPVLP